MKAIKEILLLVLISIVAAITAVQALVKSWTDSQSESWKSTKYSPGGMLDR